jgi:HTH-type transcriptional regulator/antitoxin HipB
VIYPIKTLSQLPLVLKGFRKENGLTQAAMAERLGITQQSYAHFEANPTTATLERLFMVLRMLDVEVSLNQTSPATSENATPSVKVASERPAKLKIIGQKPSAVVKVGRIDAPTRKKESW